MASGYCFTHDPERAVERRAARSKGGLLRLAPRRTEPQDGVPATPRNMEAVLRMLDFALSQTVTLETSVNRGRLLVSIAHGYIEALKTSEFEQRLTALESTLQNRQQLTRAI
jgi:hypothetical protein